MHIQYYHIKNSNTKFPTRLSTGNSLHVDFERHSEETRRPAATVQLSHLVTLLPICLEHWAYFQGNRVWHKQRTKTASACQKQLGKKF